MIPPPSFAELRWLLLALSRSHEYVQRFDLELSGPFPTVQRKKQGQFHTITDTDFEWKKLRLGFPTTF